MHMEQPFGFGVIGLERLVFERPGGRDAVLVADFVEIALAQAQQRRAIDFGIAADVIVQARMKARPSLPYQVSLA